MTDDPFIARMPFARLRRAARDRSAERGRRRRLAALLALDDRLLDDVGVDRADVACALAAAPRDNAVDCLARARARNRADRQRLADRRRWTGRRG